MHEIHWVNEPCQLHYVQQRQRLSDWKRYEVPLCQTEKFRNIVEETETNCSSKPHHKTDENVIATKTSQQICGGNCSIVAEDSSRDTAKTQHDERGEPKISERHALNQNHTLQSVEKLILHNGKLIPAICNTDDAMSIAGGGNMIAGTENRQSKSLHEKQQVFVANRAAEVLEISSMDQWRQVKGIKNPADIGTRRMSIAGLKEFVWLNGPAWLHTDEEKWPKPWCQANKVEAEQATSTVAAETKLHQTFDWDRYSSVNRIRNFIAYCMRFKTKQKGPLKADEIHGAEQILLRFVQAESFANVSKSITNSKEISKTLNIAKFSPFIEKDGTVRVNGRLKHSNLDYNAKHPILLTAKHPVVQLLLEKAHQDNLHEGTEYVRNMLQQKYWIIGLRNALRKIKSRFIKCRHRNANPIHPPIADLPRERLDEHVFPFTHTGVDYFGPFEFKFLRRTLKKWCCLFTCLTTRAIHIKVAQSLDTESCLAAVTGFIARRGYPNTIISDNGTNFAGAANELKAFMNEWDMAKIESDLAQKNIVWKCNPPGAPHFGGIWERLVQSCKKVMIAILDNRSLTDEVLSTTMCVVEQTLNARPLTAVSDDPEDLTALTTNHFLLGRENENAPFMPSNERYHDLKKSFKTAQAYADMIWKRWTREYLPEWNQGSK